MANSGKKSKKGRTTKKTGRFHVEMTTNVKLLLAACFIFGFIGMCIVVFLSSR